MVALDFDALVLRELAVWACCCNCCCVCDWLCVCVGAAGLGVGAGVPWDGVLGLDGGFGAVGIGLPWSSQILPLMTMFACAACP